MSGQPFVGEICVFAINFVPRGFARCEGQLLSVSQNTALYSLLGTTYGGNGKSTFALPNLNGRRPVQTSDGPCWIPLGLELDAVPTKDGQGIGSLGVTYAIALQGIFPPRP